MEAVPRLHMLWFAAKSSPEGTSFAPLKRYIAEFYQEDPDSYSKDVFALETLRNQAMHPAKDSCSIIKRYYCQLHSLLNRFPGIGDRALFTFHWKDLYQNHVHEITDLRFEMAAVLFNIAASHTQIGASVTRGDVDGMKVACTHFQCAAWAFGELRERFGNVSGTAADFMTTGLLVFMQQVSFAQAQECILEKSLIDNRKPNIVAKVTAQIVVYYGAALAALLTGGDDGPVSQVIDSSVYKLWKKYVLFKINYLSCILYLYQGQQSEEQQKMGERVTLYQAAWEKLEEARKESKGLPDQKEINESLTFTADVVEAKRKNAKNENEFIYHESVPELCNIPAVQGANLVNGISFSITDVEVAGEDIFARLVPMKAHEASSMYSEEKAKLLRKYGAIIEDKDAELASFMSSLTLDNLNINEEKANKIPQGIVDRCAALNANKAAIQELVSAMSQLAETCADVEANLNEIANILSEEERQENEFQLNTGVKRMPNAHITELTREYQKYIEAHARAGESNDTLRKAMELHVNNLKILARPLQEIQQSVPKLSTELNTAEVFKDVKLIVNKVNEMKAQRSQFHADLRIAVSSDDITGKVIAHGSDEGLQHLFDRELSKHERLTQLLDQNLLAQQNILQALTDAYAKAAPVLKTLADVKHKRDSFFSSLAASYDVYEDLLAKSTKGLEFYKKLSGNVQKLLARCKSARDVQSEERQQHLKSVNKQNQLQSKSSATAAPSESVSSNTPKLRDYLKAKKDNISTGIVSNVLTDIKTSVPYIPSIRPNPLGSENPSQTVCSSNTAGSSAPNEPPPPYSLQQTQYYDPNMAGYANPLYHQQQQHIAPPAYKPQASPNSQFPGQNAALANLTLQNSYNYMAQQQQQPQLSQGFGQVSAYAQQSQQHQQHSPYAYNVGVGAIDAASNISRHSSVAPYSSASSMYGTTASTAPIAPTANPCVPISNPYAATVNQHNFVASNTSTASSVAPTVSNVATSNPYGSSTSNPYASIASASSLPNPFISANPIVPPTYYSVANAATYQEPRQPQQATSYALAAQVPSHAATTSTVSQVLPTSASAATQPLHIVTTQTDALPPASLQAPFIVNTFQQSNTNNSGVLTTMSSSSAQPTSLESVSASSSFGGTTKHPGYSFNPQTGTYEYCSGYHQAASVNSQFYGHYTSASALQQMPTTDSENANKMNLATGFDSPIISHTKAAAAAATASNVAPSAPLQSQQKSENEALNYYTPPYGYHSNASKPDVATTNLQQQVNSSNQQQPQQPQQQQKPSPQQQPQQPPPQQQQPQQQSLQPLQQSTSTLQQFSTPTNAAAMNGVGPTYLSQQQQQQQQQQLQQQQQQQQQTAQAFNQHQSIYMQSGSSSIANTQTTKSAAEYASSAQHTQVPSTGQNQTAAQSTQQQNKKVSNLDLLTDIDFNEAVLNVPAPMLPAPVLQPKVLTNTAKIETTTTPITGLTMAAATITSTAESNTTSIVTAAAAVTPTSVPATIPTHQDSFDNISICSDLSSLDNNFDWDALSNFSPVNHSDKHFNTNNTTFLLKPFDAFADDKILKYFHKEVERYEKIIESLNVRMLNGNTQLSAKWKELQELLVKDETIASRTTTVAKLFPEKNRSLDCLPYDHARVKLDSITDDYINAAYVRNLGAGCPNFIFTQTPQQNTTKDFWSMVWSQKSRTVLSLHTPNEMLDPFWPQQLQAEMHFDDFTISCVQINALSHCTEYYLKLLMHGADAILDLSLLEIKSWSKDSPASLLGIARNALQAHQQRCLQFNQPHSPLILNCLTGSERSGLVALGISCILATQTKRPVLINVVDVWSRICSQRQNALRDMNVLEKSMQIVLSHAHDVLNKRGILTSYQMKIAPQVASKEKEEIKDPLSELDPLWKLK